MSFYDQAVIDARERELQQRQKDEKKEKKDRDNLAEGKPTFKIESSSGSAPGFGNDTRSGFGDDIGSMGTLERKMQQRRSQ